MTVTAEQVWNEYREKVGGTNHDGTFTLPDFHKLGERQRAGWQAVANLCNNHISDDCQKATALERQRITKNIEMALEMEGWQHDICTRDPNR